MKILKMYNVWSKYFDFDNSLFLKSKKSAGSSEPLKFSKFKRSSRVTRFYDVKILLILSNEKYLLRNVCFGLKNCDFLEANTNIIIFNFAVEKSFSNRFLILLLFTFRIIEKNQKRFSRILEQIFDRNSSEGGKKIKEKKTIYKTWMILKDFLRTIFDD